MANIKKNIFFSYVGKDNIERINQLDPLLLKLSFRR